MTALPDWMPIEAWSAYVAMRKAIPGKKMTEGAVKLQITKLEKMREEGHDIEAVLNQSTENNYTGLFEVRAQQTQRGSQQQKIPDLGKHGNATAAAAQEWLNDSPMDDTLETKRKFANLLTHLSDYYKEEISKAKLRIYWEGLKQYSYEAIDQACLAHTQNPDDAGKWMPRNSDIIKMIDGNTVDQAAMAWSKVDSAVRVRGTWDDVIFDDSIIHRVIADMGGWILVGSKDDKEWPFVGKEFQTRYRAFRMRSEVPDYPASLTGQANAHNASNNRELLPPILLGDKEKAKAVYKKGSGATLLGAQHVNESLRLVRVA